MRPKWKVSLLGEGGGVGVLPIIIYLEANPQICRTKAAQKSLHQPKPLLRKITRLFFSHEIPPFFLSVLPFPPPHSARLKDVGVVVGGWGAGGGGGFATTRSKPQVRT